MDLATKDLKSRAKKVGFWFILLTFVMSLVILIVIVQNKISFFAIMGDSMEPTLSDRDSVILQQERNVEKEQIIFFNKPSGWSDYVDRETALVKRISATPNDILTYNGKEFQVNGETIYSTEENNYECEAGDKNYKYQLTSSDLFVTGDNAKSSLDSRRIFCDGNADDMFVKKHNVINYGKIVKIF